MTDTSREKVEDMAVREASLGAFGRPTAATLRALLAERDRLAAALRLIRDAGGIMTRDAMRDEARRALEGMR